MSHPEISENGTEIVREVLITEEQIKNRVRELAGEIHKRYSGQHLVLVMILKGAFIFGADLARELGRLNQDLSVEFVQVSSYGAATESSRDPLLLLDVSDEKIKDQNVLIVEDIVDSGYTLNFLLRHFGEKADSIGIAALLSKPSRREVDVPIDFLGFEIGNVWVEGYGIDTADEFRQLPYIAARIEQA